MRPDDGLDLGLWSTGPFPRDLLLPLDTHVHRVAMQLGLTRRKIADWEASEQATRSLAVLDPEDPVRYDFALARPGIVGLCRHRHFAPVCEPCDLRTVCRHGSPPRRRERRKETVA